MFGSGRRGDVEGDWSWCVSDRLSRHFQLLVESWRTRKPSSECETCVRVKSPAPKLFVLKRTTMDNRVIRQSGKGLVHRALSASCLMRVSIPRPTLDRYIDARTLDNA